jgi:hypothetical protein
MARTVKQAGSMRKTQLKLKLKSETIRTLTPDQLRNANGGYDSALCTSQGGCSVGCTAGPNCGGSTIM